MELSSLDIFLSVLLAMFLGGIVGIEREIAKKPAGIRTHMFVAGSACLLLLIGQYVIADYSEDSTNIAADPTRIVQAIVVGISFIGAGTILKSKDDKHVFYLTTAASILFTSGLGIVVGVGLYALAAGLTAVTFAVSYGLGKLEKRFINNK